MAYLLRKNVVDGNIQIEIQTTKTSPETFTSNQISPEDHQAQASLTDPSPGLSRPVGLWDSAVHEKRQALHYVALRGFLPGQVNTKK